MQTNSDGNIAGVSRSDTLRILQITDCHLTKDPNGDLLGVRTLESLDAVLAQVAEDGRDPHVILVTGDLAQDGSETAYQVLKERLDTFDCPKYWFAGNHDARTEMAAVVGKGPELSKVITAGAWRIVLLDSLVEGKVHGELSSEELAQMERALSQEDAVSFHTMLALHHHPVAIQSAWLDNIGLVNRDAFWSIADRFSQIKAVLWGHIHQDFESSKGPVRLLASPSTCIQFLPKSDDFAIDNIAPGYRWLELHPDGSIETEVVRAESYEFKVDMASNGY